MAGGTHEGRSAPGGGTHEGRTTSPGGGPLALATGTGTVPEGVLGKVLTGLEAIAEIATGRAPTLAERASTEILAIGSAGAKLHLRDVDRVATVYRDALQAGKRAGLLVGVVGALGAAILAGARALLAYIASQPLKASLLALLGMSVVPVAGAVRKTAEAAGGLPLLLLLFLFFSGRR